MANVPFHGQCGWVQFLTINLNLITFEWKHGAHVKNLFIKLSIPITYVCIIPLYFSVRKDPETKEIQIISTVFRVSAYVSMNIFLVQEFIGSNMNNMKIVNWHLHKESIIFHFKGLFFYSCCHFLIWTLSLIFSFLVLFTNSSSATTN